MLRPLEAIKRLTKRIFSGPSPVTHEYRNREQDLALVLVHGFSGSVRKVWAQFGELVLDERRLANWDVVSAGYTTSLRVDIPHVWAADPNLQTLSDNLRLTLTLPPFDRYRSLAIVAHSMGGLVIQRAILDDERLSRRVSHLLLFGVPSGGLKKGRLFAALKRQIRDIDADGQFIQKLRRDWTKRFREGLPFILRVVSGDRDEFVPSSSSLIPFGDEVRATIVGNHSDMVRPTTSQHQGFSLVVQTLTAPANARAVVDNARLAVELGEFQSAVDALLPRVAALDESALVTLALALDALKRGDEALGILEQYGRDGTGFSTTDALGTLAGRIKRRWLLERAREDLDRARALYQTAYGRSSSASDHEQAFYHAINLAFLELMASPANSAIPDAAARMAQTACEHCTKVSESSWSLATEGEAALILGNLERAEMFYRRAIEKTSSPREIDSMYNQAIRVATRVFRAKGARKIEQLFGFS